MLAMPSGFWEQVVADGLKVPQERSLVEMTEDLTRMLGDPDPDVRDGIAFPTMATWIDEGVYDDLLVGLGDGMCHGLDIGLGETESDTVFRRSFSALILTECIDRTTKAALGGPNVVLRWGDKIMGWYSRERDLRGFVAGKGWAHAVAHGADAIGTLAESPHMANAELTVLLDVIADRLTLPVDAPFAHGEPDRMAAATMCVLRRNVVPLSLLEPWVTRLASAATARALRGTDPFLQRSNSESFLRALYLQLSLAPHPPLCRPDLLLVLVDALRRTNPYYLATGE
jgi:hypothetical protein